MGDQLEFVYLKLSVGFDNGVEQGDQLDDRVGGQKQGDGEESDPDSFDCLRDRDVKFINPFLVWVCVSRRRVTWEGDQDKSIADCQCDCVNHYAAGLYQFYLSR